MKRPGGVTFIAVLAILGGGVQLLASLGYFGLQALRTAMWIGVVSGLTPVMMLGSGVLSLVIGVAAIAFGVGALSLKSWAWGTGLVVWSISLLVSIVQLFVTGFATVPVISGLVAIAIIAYLASAPARAAFGIQPSDHYTTQHPSAV